MAGFCAKCGAPHSSDTGFCSTCGAPITAAASAPPAAVPPPTAAPPVAAYAPAGVVYGAPPPQKSGALKVILIIIAVVVGLGVLGVGTAGFVAYRALHKAGAAFSAGSAAAVTEADLGTSIYPGATQVDNGSARIKIGSILSVTSSYTTSDPVSSVVSFYRDKMGANAMVNETPGGTVIQSARSSGNAGEGTTVTVVPDSRTNGSRIVISHIEKSGS